MPHNVVNSSSWERAQHDSQRIPITTLPPGTLYNLLSAACAGTCEIFAATEEYTRIRGNTPRGQGFGLWWLLFSVTFVATAILTIAGCAASPIGVMNISMLVMFLSSSNGAIVASLVYHFKNKKVKADELALYWPAVEAAGQRVDALINHHGNTIIQVPARYRYPLALATMCDLLLSGRANSWVECADKYEEQYHRWTMEVYGRESLMVQQQIHQATSTAAAFAGAAAIFSGISAVANLGR